YTFELQDGECPVGDETGVWFADRADAVDHAHEVARELMSAREFQTRTWRLDVYEDGSRVEQIPFAHLDPTLDHLNPALRTHVERGCDTLRDYKQAMCAARATVQESRALVGRSRGKPYLATDGGKPTMAISIQTRNDVKKLQWQEGETWRSSNDRTANGDRS
ncbi:MAG: hypothetical protein JO220_01300, partial [Hyphomicrobiales bacterium]|nr:hypothetical protein [Hyphomicrobiales bacterium]